MLYLKEITYEDKEAFCEFEKRYKLECGNEKIPYSLNPKNLAFEDFLNELALCKQSSTLPKDFVLADTYLIYVDGRIVGGINLRKGTNDFILNYAGHIGYGIAPWERNKGYAKEALKKLLILAMDFGMKDFLLTTNINNVFSQRVIEACGGVLEKSTSEMKYYWFHYSDWKREESAMAIVFLKDRILTTKELIYGKEVISCPKGHIENQETHIETAIRECFEETNVSITKQDFVLEENPYQIKFMDHHNQPVLKTIYPVCFCIQEEGNLLPKEERILEISYMEFQKFLTVCSYDNVKGMVEACWKKLNNK